MEGLLFKLLEPLWSTASTAEMIDKLARTPLSKIIVISAVLTVLRIALYKYLKDTPQHQRFGVFKVAKWVDSFSDAVVYAAVVVFMLVRPFVLQTFYIPSGSMIDTLHVGDFVVLNKNIYRHSEPQRGEIVVFKPPPGALFEGQDPETDFIKRLIGVAGDIVEWKGKKMYRNGQLVDEPAADYTTPGNPDGPALPQDSWDTIPQSDYKLVKDGDRYIPVQYTANAVNMFPLNMEGENPGLTACDKKLEPSSLEEALRWKSLPPAAIPDGYFFFMGDNRNGSFDGRSWGLVPRDQIIGKAEFIWLPLHRWRKLG